ncbi:MAG: hypothetical protein EOO40_08060 [Deltaproteobacteria bacterium]|nr:MAG: hypothetical protein EOO40_08060 [Deltaproteobacteria bacterium]
MLLWWGFGKGNQGRSLTLLACSQADQVLPSVEAFQQVAGALQQTMSDVKALEITRQQADTNLARVQAELDGARHEVAGLKKAARAAKEAQDGSSELKKSLQKAREMLEACQKARTEADVAAESSRIDRDRAEASERALNHRLGITMADRSKAQNELEDLKKRLNKRKSPG